MSRVRDPARKAKILAAAADLIGARGYANASMTEIGQAAGITGSGVYRHFDGKASILVELFEQTIDDLLAGEREVVDAGLPPARALAAMVDGQVSFVVDQRELARVYHNEVLNLPDEDRTRLRAKQRRYVDTWVELVSAARPEVSGPEARTLVHAAIGAIQSPLFHRVDVDPETLRAHLTGAATAVLGLRRRRRVDPPG